MPNGQRNPHVERVRPIRSTGFEMPEPIAHAVADGKYSDPFGDGVLSRFWTWRSVRKTFGNSAVSCHPRAFADGNCTYPFRDGMLNRFWAWRSGMETFSNVGSSQTGRAST
jgi:hypothetical protein